MPRPHHAQRTVLHAAHSLSAVITGPGNLPPVISTQPPATLNLYLGIPAVWGFGSVTDPNSDQLQVTLQQAPSGPGLSLDLNGSSVRLHWDGVGAGVEETRSVRFTADDGQP